MKAYQTEILFLSRFTTLRIIKKSPRSMNEGILKKQKNSKIYLTATLYVPTSTPLAEITTIYMPLVMLSVLISSTKALSSKERVNCVPVKSIYIGYQL